MKVAIIGGGISGLTAAYMLNKTHKITLFESAEYLGGHTATKEINFKGQSYAIDTGFIVFNDWTYPNFIRLLNEIGVESKPTVMGFSAFKNDGSFYYSGESVNSLFAKRSLIFSSAHWRLLKDIVRFNSRAVRDWNNGALPIGQTLGEYLACNNYSQAFMDHYLMPMGAAIWSASTQDMKHFDMRFFVRFFINHGLLNVFKRPTWRVIKGGSQQYIEPLIESFKEQIKLGEKVHSVSRGKLGVRLETDKASYQFDKVIFACHSDQALSLLTDPTLAEWNVLGAIEYRNNTVTLHTDTAWLPPKSRAWSSWNYCLDNDASSPPVVTYNMNILQGLVAPVTFCVTLNAKEKIKPSEVLGQFEYAHPVLTQKAIDAQTQWQEISSDNTLYCGAYWFNGFHEDGVNSALRVAKILGVNSQ